MSLVTLNGGVFDVHFHDWFRESQNPSRWKKKATVPGKGFDESHQTWQCWKKFNEKYVVHCCSNYSQEFLSIQYITIYSYIYSIYFYSHPNYSI